MENENDLGAERYHDCAKFHMLENRVVQYVTGIIERTRPDAVVLIHRKGWRIFQDIFNHHPEFKGLKVLGDTSFSSSDISNKSLLILDDSMKTGDSVSKTLDEVIGKGTKVTVAALHSNKNVMNALSKKYVGLTVYGMDIFEDATDQDAAYPETLEILVAGLAVKYGRGYPSLELRMSNDERFKDIISIVNDTLNGMFDCEIEEVKSNSCRPSSTQITARIGNMHDDYGICDQDDPKIRVYADTAHDGEIYLVLEVLINPVNPEKDCEGRITENRLCDFDHEINGQCVVCGSLHISRMVLKDIEREMKNKFQSKGIKILGSTRHLPSEHRFHEEVRR